ncbi:MAG: LUD domain-containing protein [Actinomycetota bacterium]|nr:LUD domain-containing protein [Actinomycetota bacterium]
MNQSEPAAMSAREEILARVRLAIASSSGRSVHVPRDYRTEASSEIPMFLDRLAHYEAAARVVDESGLEHAVRSMLRARGAKRVVSPAGIPAAWLAEVEPLCDAPLLTPDQLDGADGVVTTCAAAIALTGTIVLDGSPGMGRRALTLVPDYHLCVVRAAQLVGSVPEAIAALEPSRPLTFISGPSATVDIEMVRVRGVHGPRTLEVIVVS